MVICCIYAFLATRFSARARVRGLVISDLNVTLRA